jgi:hypothetical protein
MCNCAAEDKEMLTSQRVGVGCLLIDLRTAPMHSLAALSSC